MTYVPREARGTETKTFLQENLTMRRNLCVLALLALITAALLPSVARAETTVSRFKGISAYASFTSIDPTGCIYSYTDVSVYENVSRTSGSSSEYSVAYAYFFQYDYCQNLYLNDFYGSANLAPNAFDTRGKLRSAHLVTTMDVYSYQTNSTFQVSIDLTWTGVGDIVRGNSHYRTSYPNYKIMSHQVGSSSAANVTGTVLLGDTNLTPQPSDYATLYENQNGSVVVTH
jgi:hypothetical protein